MAGYSALYFPAVQLAGVATATVVSIGAAPLLSGAAHTFSGARVDRRWLTSTSVAVVGMCLVVLPGSHDPASRLGILLATLRGRAAGRARPGRRSRSPTRSFPRAVRPRRRPPRHHDSRIPRGDLLVGPVGLALEGGEEPVERVELPQVVPAPVEGVSVDGLQRGGAGRGRRRGRSARRRRLRLGGARDRGHGPPRWRLPVEVPGGEAGQRGRGQRPVQGRVAVLVDRGEHRIAGYVADVVAPVRAGGNPAPVRAGATQRRGPVQGGPQHPDGDLAPG